MTEEKIVSDAIFGFITLKPHIIAIIDTPEFQRLRCIYQLGVVPFVYPTADHNRFEHCIGTYWIASKLVTQIQKQLKDEKAEKQISDKEVMYVEIAALCHDIGHGPFSHFWDKTLLPHLFGDNFVSHEQQFVDIWKILEKNKKVEKVVQQYLLDGKVIGELIDGRGDDILRDIVNNKESGMDVDKWDYLARDIVYLGHSSTNYRADIDRMIHYTRAIKDKDGKWKIAFRDSEGLNMFRVFYLRHYLYKTAYRHRTVVAIEEMLLDGFLQCLEKKILTLDEIGTSEWILQNTDSIFWSNMRQIPSFLRIINRDLYKPILEAVTYEIDLDEKEIKNKCLNKEYGDLANIRFTFYEFKLGNHRDNPLLSIPFYNIHKKMDIFKYKDENRILPPHLHMDCNESRIIIYSTEFKNKEDQNENKIIEKISEYLKNNNWIIHNIK